MADLSQWLQSENAKMLGATFILKGMPRVMIFECSGNCPVQAEGKIDNWHWHYRARHGGWSLEVYKENTDEDILWDTEGKDKEDGWGNAKTSFEHIGEALQKFWDEVGAFYVIETRFGEDILDKLKEKLKEN